MVKPDERKKIANIAPFGLRMQPDLKRQVEEAARASGRSLNSEIVARLEASLRDDDERSTLAKDRILAMRLTDTPDPVIDRLTKLEKRVDALDGRVKG